MKWSEFGCGVQDVSVEAGGRGRGGGGRGRGGVLASLSEVLSGASAPRAQAGTSALQGAETIRVAPKLICSQINFPNYIYIYIYIS